MDNKCYQLTFFLSPKLISWSDQCIGGYTIRFWYCLHWFPN